jgi:prepilin-type processing-associated H-X9-DG protein
MEEKDTGRIVRFGKANYAAYTSPMHVDSWGYSGAIWLFDQRMSRITDGTSQTLALSEVRTREHSGDQRGAWALPWSGASLLAFDMHPAKPEDESCQRFQCLDFAGMTNAARSGIAKFSPWKGSIGYTQSPNGRWPDILYDCPEEELAQLERMQCERFDKAMYMSASPRSNHPGGVNAAYLDGRVTFLTNDTDEFAMSLMVSIDDGLSPEER